MFDQIFILVAFTWGILANILAVWLGFKMGRKTQGQSSSITEHVIEDADKNTIDGPDIFTENLNLGMEGDPNERIRTI